MNKNLDNYVRVFENVLGEQECSQIVSHIETKNFFKHSYYNPREGTETSYDYDLSICYDDEDSWEVGYIHQRIHNTLTQYYTDLNFPWYSGWNMFTRVRFNKYDVNTRMNLHCDHIHSMFDGERKGVPIMTVLGALNNDYKGGELVLFEDTTIDLKAGSLIVFPSNFLFPHRVDTITEGVRYSFVSWVA